MRLSRSQFHANVDVMLVVRIFDPQSDQLYKPVSLIYVDDGCPGGFKLVHHQGFEFSFFRVQQMFRSLFCRT